MKRALISARAGVLFDLVQGDIERVLFNGPAIHGRLRRDGCPNYRRLSGARTDGNRNSSRQSVVCVRSGSLNSASLEIGLPARGYLSRQRKDKQRRDFQTVGSSDIASRDVLIMDDILDTRQTLTAVRKKLETAKPYSVRVCVLLSKRKQRAHAIDADDVGFEIDDEFVVGYGLDFMERYRNLPHIGVLKKEMLEHLSQ